MRHGRRPPSQLAGTESRPAPGCNLELKAGMANPARAEAALRALGASYAGTLQQRDTYFHVESGRLKLREEGNRAELIDYTRDEDRATGDGEPGAGCWEPGRGRWSQYRRTPVKDTAAVRVGLARELGVRGVVEKARRVWLYRNARIHLDEVAELGNFLEIEVVNPRSPAAALALLEELRAALALDEADERQGSYIDLVVGQGEPPANAEGASQATLPDILTPGLDLVFVGINPSIYSAERGHYFARPSNRFWAVLNQSGLVPERLGPEDDVRLPAFGIGLTDIVKRPTHDAAEVTASEFIVGREVLRQKLVRYAPRAVCFVGKLAYQQYSGRRTAPFGEQAERIGEAAIFVMPSTSGLVNNLHAERLRCLEEVRAFLTR